MCKDVTSKMFEYTFKRSIRVCIHRADKVSLPLGCPPFSVFYMLAGWVKWRGEIHYKIDCHWSLFRWILQKMTRITIATSADLGEVHQALVLSRVRLPIAANIKKVLKRVIMKHLKLSSMLTHWHIFVLLTGVLLKVTPYCDSLQQRFSETPGCCLPGTNSTSGEKLNTANTETFIYNHL